MTLIGLVVLAGCSSDSPSAKPVPTVVPDTWAIPALAVSDADPYLGAVVLVTATVTRNGSPAPDGTTVEFLTDARFTANGTTEALVTTENGTAQIFMVADEAGTYTVQAKVRAVTRQTTVTYIERSTDDSLEIYQPLLPNEGSYDGGEQVFINGKGIIPPVEVDFVVQGVAYPAIIQNVVQSVPASATGTITIRTPYISGADRFQATTANINVRASLNTVPESVTLTSAFTFLAEPSLQVYQPFVPRSGVYDGGTLVTIRGRAIKAPVSVVFRVQGQDYAAQVTSVIESNPPSAQGQIVVETPFISAADRTQDSPSDVTVSVAVNTPNALSETVPSAFLFYEDPENPPDPVPYWVLGEPAIYLVLPDYGPSAGGNTVTILGRNFRAQLIDIDNTTVLENRAVVEEIRFGNLEGQVTSVSQDGTQVDVIVPRYSITPLVTNQTVDVSLATARPDDPNTPLTASRNNAYIFLADEPEPEIASISPTAGPLDGGTPVTIFGSGFQTPVQVMFGDLPATEVQVIDDQTLADHDEIRCLSPDYSQQGVTPPATVDVTVTNMQTGNSATAPVGFTYGENLFISGNSPSQGQRGDFVIVYGSGFEDPLRLFLLVNGETELEVTRVAGTEITARIPNDVVTCGDLSGEFRVELIESNDLSAQGGGFTLIGNNPRVLSVDPLFVQEIDDGDGVTPSDITINGQRFATGAIVEIGPYRIPNDDIDIVDETVIEVSNIPPPDLFNLNWVQVSCLTDDGIPGVRRAATPVDVAVINIPGQCRDVLSGGIVYEPESPECLVASAIQVEPRPVVFPPTPATLPPGDDNPVVPVYISNIGAGDMIVQSISKIGASFSIVSISPPVPVTLAPFQQIEVVVEFNPTVDDGALNTGTLGIFHTAPNEGNPLNIPLQGQEAFGVISVSPQIVDFGTADTGGAPVSEILTVSNTGDEAVSINGAFVSDAGVFASTPVVYPYVLEPGASLPITLWFSSPADGDFNGVYGFTNADPSDTDPQGLPRNVTLTATAETPAP